MFKERFVKLCTEKGVSPAMVCECIGLSNSAYSKWTETSCPRDTTLFKIANYFNVSAAYLKGETDDPEITLADRLGETKENPANPKTDGVRAWAMAAIDQLSEEDFAVVAKILRSLQGQNKEE